MVRRRFVRMLAAGVMLLIGALPSSAANFVLEWNEAMIVAIRKEAIPPDLVARNLAILHLAIQRSQLAGANDNDAAVTGAGFSAAVALMPGHQAAFEVLRDSELGEIGESAKPQAAFARGAEAARQLLAERAGDGSTVLVTYIPSVKPGQWRRTPPFFRPPELPQFASKVKPLVLQSPAQFRPKGPPPMEEAAWAQALNEIKELGGKTSATRTPYQTETARFWADFSYTETPPGHWNSIARTIAADRGLSPAECARLFAVLNVALFDTAIACWEAKYFFNLWRPATAIPRAAEDGNPATEPDAAWVSLLPTPAHPEYVSGHSAFSSAAATVLAESLGGDAITFTVRSDTVRNVERRFESLQACAKECAESRIFAGIHYRFSCEDGSALGEAVAREVLKSRFAR